MAAASSAAARAAAPVASADRSIVLALTVIPASVAIRAAALAKETSAPARAIISARPGDSDAAGHAEPLVAGRETRDSHWPQ